MDVKRCACCKKEKSFGEFYKQPTGKLGLHAYCKKCCKEKNNERYNTKQWRDYYLDRQDHYDKYQHDYYKENKERVVKRFKKYYGENRDRLLEGMKSWRDNNPDKTKAHRAVGVAKANGLLKIPKICECGCGYMGKLEFHHVDYTKPLQGVFLRKGCHRKVHSGNKEYVEKINKIFKKKYGF